MKSIKQASLEKTPGDFRGGTEIPVQGDKEMSDLEKKLKAIAIRKQDRRKRQAQAKAKKRKVLLEYYDALQQVEKHGLKIIQLVQRRKKSLEPRINQLTEPSQPQGVALPNN